MTSTQSPRSGRSGVDVAPTASTTPSYVALVLGILSVPGSILTWDTNLPGQGFVWGLIPALVAVCLGAYALRSTTVVRWAAITGIVLGGAMVLMTTVWTVASLG